MSTVLIAFKADNPSQLREQIGAMKLLIEQNPAIAAYGKREGIEMQVFRTSVYSRVYRILEDGYGLRNKMWKHPNIFPSCGFDSRVESESDNPKGSALADEVDGLIGTKQYYIESIVAKEEA